MESDFGLYIMKERRRHLLVVDGCLGCGLQEESILHALWGCDSLRPICTSCRFMMNLKFSSSMTFLDFILSTHHQLSRSNFLVLVIVFWRIWFRRNRIIHDKIILCSKDVVDWAYSFLEEFTAANIVTNSSLLDVANSSLHDSSSDGISLLHGTTPNGWIPPPAGFFKINVDASVLHSQDSAGLGAACRNDMGLVMWSCSMRSLCYDVLCAEAKALILGLSLASDLGFHSFILESDALSLVQLIHSDLSPLSEIGLLLQDIRDDRVNMLRISQIRQISQPTRSSRMFVGYRLTKILVDVPGSPPTEVPANACRFSANEGPRGCSLVVSQRRSSHMLAGSRLNKVLRQLRSSRMLTSSKPKKVIADARNFSTNEGHRDACRFSTKECPHGCSQVLDQRRSLRMLVGYHLKKVLTDARRFSTKEGPHGCLQVLGQRRSLRMLTGSQPKKVLTDARRFSKTEGPRGFSGSRPKLL
ncbi:hypothetical protein ACOSQ4_028878 [Xanthoceras sorbifolium]